MPETTKLKFELETRHIKVYDPAYPGIVLFEAVVRIANLNKALVKKISKVDISYELKTTN